MQTKGYIGFNVQEAVLDGARKCCCHPDGRSLLRDKRAHFLVLGASWSYRIRLKIKSYFRAKRRDLYAEKMKFCSLENAPFYNTDIHCHVGIVHEKGHPLAMDCCPSTYTVLVCSLSLNLGDVASQKTKIKQAVLNA